jgi:RNA polymerase sigma factor (sigma-70 family)
VEASALQAPAGIARSRIFIGAPLLRLRSDEQLVALFRAGNEEAFRVIHDRYRQRLFAYTRQMLPGARHDAEDALQDIFVRAYSGLRANDRELALRAWLYRVAHNRCVDELRRPVLRAPEVMELVRAPIHDPIAEAERRESLRRLIADVRRLPEQQRSALLMRELGGMSYADLAGALGVSVPAVKSLLVRARVGLAQALEARDTACVDIREELTLAHDRGVRASGLARRHMHDCQGCREFRGQMRGLSRQFASLMPTLGPVGVIANLLGFGGGAGGAAGGSAAAGGGAVAAGSAGTSGAIAGVGALASGAGHVATLLAAAVVTAGGAVEIQRTIAPPAHHHAAHHVRAVARDYTTTAPVGEPSSTPTPAVAVTAIPATSANPAPPNVTASAPKAPPTVANPSGTTTALPATPGSDTAGVNQLNPKAAGTGGTSSTPTATGATGTSSGTVTPSTGGTASPTSTARPSGGTSTGKSSSSSTTTSTISSTGGAPGATAHSSSGSASSTASTTPATTATATASGASSSGATGPTTASGPPHDRA